MKTIRPLTLQQGFSLLEMAVVMTIIGFIAVLVPRLVGDVATMQTTVKNEAPHEVAQVAVLGFALANHRLPCPDTDGDGVEDCSGSARRGGLPHRSLGLPGPLFNASGHPYAYAAHRGASHDLTALAADFAPALPETNPTAAVRNGLDFCQSLRMLGESATLPPAGEPSAGGVGVPFALVDPGANDADRAGELFDLSNTGSGVAFESPDRPQSDDYDDIVHAASHAVLLGQLDCPRLIAAASGAAREANTAWDIWRAGVFYESFREHNLRVRENGKESADFKYIMSVYVNTVLTAALVANDMTVALSSVTGAAAIAVATVNSVIAIATAVYGVITALEGQDKAEADLETAEKQLENATANKVRARSYYEQSLARALLIDQRGWHQ